MNEAIKLAIENGGYSPTIFDEQEPFNTADLESHFGEHTDNYKNYVLLDPQFWQALGRALGWKAIHINDDYGQVGCSELCIKEYMTYWHRFIDWIAEGKNPDDFFKQLINKD